MIRRLLPVVLGLAAGCGGPPPAPLVETIATGDVSNPTLARARDGTIYVSWVGTDSTGGNIWLAHRAPDGTIGAPVRVNDRLGDGHPAYPGAAPGGRRARRQRVRPLAQQHAGARAPVPGQ